MPATASGGVGRRPGPPTTTSEDVRIAFSE